MNNTTSNGPVCVVCIAGGKGLEVTNHGKMSLGADIMNIPVGTTEIYKEKNGEFVRRLPDGKVIKINDQERAKQIFKKREDKNLDQEI